MRQTKTGWKWAMALFSLLLTVLIWRQGLQESFERPSVAPKISLMQAEMAVSASSSIPEKIQDVFLGSEPQKKLYQALSKIPLEQIEDRQRPVSYTHLRAHETDSYLVCRLLLGIVLLALTLKGCFFLGYDLPY